MGDTEGKTVERREIEGEEEEVSDEERGVRRGRIGEEGRRRVE